MPEKLRRTSSFYHGEGLNTDTNVLALRSGEAVIADNCDRDTAFSIRKRNGNLKLVTLPGKIVGIFDFEFTYGSKSAATTVHQHLAYLDDARLFRREADGTWIDVGGFYDVQPAGTVDHVSFAPIAGDVYLVDGAGRMTVYDGTTRYYAGITPPPGDTARPTFTLIAKSGPVGLTGVYNLWYTYFYEDPRTGRLQESAPSFKPIPFASPVGQAIRWAWTIPSKGIGERISGVRLYRTVANAGGSGPYLFLEQIDDTTTTTYDDETDDSELGLEIGRIPQDKALPPVGAVQSILFNNMHFAFGSSTNPQRVRFSDLGEYEYFPDTNFLDLPAKSTSTFTGAVVHNRVLVVHFEDRIFHITGTDPNSVTYAEMRTNSGSVSQGSVQAAGNAIMRLDRDGFYTWDLLQNDYVGGKIEDSVKGTPLDNLRQCKSAHLKSRTHIYFAYPWTDGEIRWLVFDYSTPSSRIGTEDITAGQAWFRYTGRESKMAATGMGVVYDYTDRTEQLLWGNADGELFQFDVGLTDDGEPIDMQYRFYLTPQEVGRLSSGPVALTFIARHWMVFTDRWTGNMTFRWGYFDTPYLDLDDVLFGAVENLTGPGDKRDVSRLNLNGYGKGALLLDLTHSDVGEVRILGHEILWRFFLRGLREGRT